MVPGIGHQGTGVDFVCGVLGVPEHGFLGDNGNYGSGQGNKGRGFPVHIGFMDNGGHAFIANAQAGEQQDKGQEQGGNVLLLFVAVLMVLIGGPAGQHHPENHDDGTEHIGSGVDGIGNHGGGMAKNPGQEFKGAEHQVDDNAHIGNVHGNIAAALGRITHNNHLESKFQ